MRVNFFNQPYVLYIDDMLIYRSSMSYNTHTIGAGTEWTTSIVLPPQAIIIVDIWK